MATLKKLLGRDEPMGREKSIDEQISELVRDGIRIGMRLANQQNDSSTRGEIGSREAEEEQGGMVDVLSPRFLSITERKTEEKLKVGNVFFDDSTKSFKTIEVIHR